MTTVGEAWRLRRKKRARFQSRTNAFRKSGGMIRRSGDLLEADGTVGAGDAEEAFAKFQILGACFEENARQHFGLFKHLVGGRSQCIAADDRAPRAIRAAPE